MTNFNLKKIFFLLSCLSGTLLFGTLGLYFTENYSIFDSFYMTLITVSTVGFSEIHPMSTDGRIIIIIVISSGISIVAYSAGTLIKMIIEGELTKSLGRKRLDKYISSLKNHYIICGYGRIGSLIAKELQSNNLQFVVIENNQSEIAQLEHDKMIYIIADATNEEAVIKAGLMNAKALITCVKSDSDNVFITLSARSINPAVYILSRASEEQNEKKLMRAGANKVVLPYFIGGRRMAHALLRPTVVDFIDNTMVDSKLGAAITMEELVINQKSDLIGKNLIESSLRKNYGVIIVAIKKLKSGMLFNPAPLEVIEEGDILVILGRKDTLMEIKKLI
ncbi:MAG: potassium channel protein [Spirochaetes bacterium]|nr:potassium channel protein [Spirochaetota bacterium]